MDACAAATGRCSGRSTESLATVAAGTSRRLWIAVRRTIQVGKLPLYDKGRVSDQLSCIIAFDRGDLEPRVFVLGREREQHIESF